MVSYLSVAEYYFLAIKIKETSGFCVNIRFSRGVTRFSVRNLFEKNAENGLKFL